MLSLSVYEALLKIFTLISGNWSIIQNSIFWTQSWSYNCKQDCPRNCTDIVDSIKTSTYASSYRKNLPPDEQTTSGTFEFSQLYRSLGWKILVHYFLIAKSFICFVFYKVFVMLITDFQLLTLRDLVNSDDLQVQICTIYYKTNS